MTDFWVRVGFDDGCYHGGAIKTMAFIMHVRDEVDALKAAAKALESLGADPHYYTFDPPVEMQEALP